jgi:ribosomal protein L16 Arg81 hydroxylase
MSTPRDQYLARVLGVLQSNPTASELDFLVEAFANVGYLAAEAEGLAEDAENLRKHEEASAYLRAKRSAIERGEKLTEREAEAIAAVETRDLKTAEVEARTKARKLKNLLDSLEQAINAIKFLGRQAG